MPSVCEHQARHLCFGLRREELLGRIAVHMGQFPKQVFRVAAEHINAYKIEVPGERFHIAQKVWQTGGGRAFCVEDGHAQGTLKRLPVGRVKTGEVQ